MLAGVPLALARNMPGAGPADFLILSELTPPALAACNPEVVGSTPPPSIESKTVVFTVFFALQGCETQVKCTFWRFSGYHSIWVALITFRYSTKKKVSWWARPPTWPCWLPFGGRFFLLVTFKLPFHALPLLSPHPASFRSFTPGGLKYFLERLVCGMVQTCSNNFQDHVGMIQTYHDSYPKMFIALLVQQVTLKHLILWGQTFPLPWRILWRNLRALESRALTPVQLRTGVGDTTWKLVALIKNGCEERERLLEGCWKVLSWKGVARTWFLLNFLQKDG